MKLLLPILLCSLGYAQTPAPQPATVTVSQPSYVFLGSEASVASSPKPAGFAAVALPIGQGTWSYSMYLEYFVNGKPATSTTTGLAKLLWDFMLGRVKADILGLFTAGATTSGTATTGSVNIGGGIMFENLFPKWKWLDIFVGYLKTTASSMGQDGVVVAISKSWGK